MQMRRWTHESPVAKHCSQPSALGTTGRLDGFWEIGLAPWDVTAGVVLVREAGGLVTDFAARDWAVGAGDVLAAPPAMHAWLAAQA